MKKLATATAALLASATTASLPAWACGNGLSCQNPAAVPEISALEGTAALAALAAIVLFTWERRRRAH